MYKIGISMAILHAIEYILNIATIFIGYSLVITLAGAFRAWVAHKMGDDTAQDWGFLTLNPFVHIDPVGLIVLVFSGYGWGKHVPVNPFNIMGKWYRLRILIATFSDAFFYIFSSIIALLLLTYVDKSMKIMPLLKIFDSNYLSLATITKAHQHIPSIIIIATLILVLFIRLGVALCALSFLVNGIDTTLFITAAHTRQSLLLQYMNNTYRLLITGLIFVLIFSSLFEKLCKYIFFFILHISDYIAYLLGIL